MLTATEAFFLDSVKSFLHPEYECRIPLDINWIELKAISIRHCMSEIVYTGSKITKENCSEYAYFYQTYYNAAYRYANLKREYRTLAASLTEKGIKFLPFKGIVLAEYYTKPICRTMGDIDILVHTEDKAQVHELLINAGFTNDVHADHEWGYYKNNVYFEVHDHLLHNETVNPKAYQEYCDGCWQYAKEGEGTCLTLDDNFHFVFLLLHLRKHFMNEGVGFRQFLDLCVMVERGLNWKWISSQLELLNLTAFAEIVMSLCKTWFGTMSPLVKELDPTFYENATKKILADGVFGFSNPANDRLEIVNEFRESNAPHWMKYYAYVLKKSFQPYRILKNQQNYKYLQNMPWLLPFAWIHRGAHVLHDRRHLLLSTLKQARSINQAEVDAAHALYKEWGL